MTTHEYVKAIEYYSTAVAKDPSKRMLRHELAGAPPAAPDANAREPEEPAAPQSVRPAAAVQTSRRAPCLPAAARPPSSIPWPSSVPSAPPPPSAELYLELQKYEQATKELQLLLEGGDATDGVELEELHLRVKALLLLSRVHKEQVSVRAHTRHHRAAPPSHLPPTEPLPHPSSFTSRHPTPPPLARPQGAGPSTRQTPSPATRRFPSPLLAHQPGVAAP